jgi:hypothetical protein
LKPCVHGGKYMQREPFYQSLGAMLALIDHPLFVDTLPVADPRNTTSQILRLGLAVNCFSSLESYISSCFERAIGRLPSAKLQFSDFPHALKDFLVVDAVAGLATRGGHVDEPERFSFYDDHLSRLAGYAVVPATFSSLGFRPKGSNVDSRDITTAFKAFQIKNVWNEVSSITTEIGTSLIDLASEYNQLSKCPSGSFASH